MGGAELAFWGNAGVCRACTGNGGLLAELGGIAVPIPTPSVCGCKRLDGESPSRPVLDRLGGSMREVSLVVGVVDDVPIAENWGRA